MEILVLLVLYWYHYFCINYDSNTLEILFNHYTDSYTVEIIVSLDLNHNDDSNTVVPLLLVLEHCYCCQVTTTSAISKY